MGKKNLWSHAFPNPDSSPKREPHSVTVKDTGLTQVWRNLKLKPYQIPLCGPFSTTSKDVKRWTQKECSPLKGLVTGQETTVLYTVLTLVMGDTETQRLSEAPATLSSTPPLNHAMILTLTACFTFSEPQSHPGNNLGGWEGAVSADRNGGVVHVTRQC